MTSVERFVNGFPDNPPTSTLFSDVNPSREMVVLVAITPAILVSFTISIISNNCSFVKSGAIFRRIGFVLTFVLFKSCNVCNNFVKGSFSCNSRKFGVFGELTLTTK